MTPDEEADLVDAVKRACSAIESMQKIMLENHSMIAASLQIAQDYKRTLGDPLKHGVYAMTVLWKAITWGVGLVLMAWGIREVFDHFFVRKP